MPRRRTTPSTIAITGAGSGLGAALARQYASTGRTLFLCGRRLPELQRTGDDCVEHGADVRMATVDVRDQRNVETWISDAEATKSIDLAIVNAGVFGGREEPEEFENLEMARTIIETNLVGAIYCAYAFARPMRDRGRGQIAIISSLAACLPVADAPAYSASKAGLSAYGIALREDLSMHGVDVSIVHPGHIDTAQTSHHNGLLPLIMTPEDAAQRIAKGLSNRSEISFPKLASLWVTFGSKLPWRLRAWMNRKQRFTVSHEDPS